MQREQLFLKTKKLVEQEKQITLMVLKNLQVIELKKYHLEAGFRSLHEFAVQYLGYDDGSAWRRIQAMRLLKEVPELEEKIESGKISLTTAAHLGHRMRAKPLSEKKALLAKMEGKSTRESMELLHAAEPAKKILASDVDLDDELKALLLQYKKEFGEAQLKAYLKRRLAQKASAQKLSPAKRIAPASLRRMVFKKDGGRCQFVDRSTYRQCSATRYLELDHKIPFAWGGTTEIGNLRLLCSAHHRLVSEEQFGSFRAEAPPADSAMPDVPQRSPPHPEGYFPSA